MNDVLDAAVFLLFVSAAVGMLAVPTGQPDSGSADERLVSFPSTGGPEFDRTARGTLAELLAAAATSDLSVEGEEVTRTSDGFERAVAAATENATRASRPSAVGRHRRSADVDPTARSDRMVAVRAVWEPYPNSSVRGAVRVGPRPPPTADVWSVSTVVGSGYPAARDRAIRAARDDGYAGVARVVSRAVVAGAFPPDATRLALRGDYPVDALVTYRYRRFAALTGASVEDAVDGAETRRANARLARALAPRIERELRASFDSPAEAARAVEVGEVRITVREWSR